MRKRLWLFSAILVLTVVAAALWFAGRRPTPPVHSGGMPPELAFVTLEEAVAPEVADRWEVIAPPKSSGPYRRLAEGPTVYRAGDRRNEWVTCRGWDAAGSVTEELGLLPNPAFDQLVVSLDTADARRTFVVMHRPP